jgi:hypothetical protein
MPNQDWLKALQNSPVAKLNPHIVGGDVQKKSKYHNEKVLDEFGNEYDSKKERKRAKELKILLKAGEIGFLARQVEYVFHMKGGKVASYFADFQYTTKEGEIIVEDVKSKMTRTLPVYRLKRKMMLLQHKIKIREV